MTASDLQEIGARCEQILDSVEEAIIGKRATLTLVLAALLSDGHVIIEDLPGLAKTLMARSFAVALGLDVARVQFTPDLMPADVTGSAVFDQRTRNFEFRAGPVFTNLLLADEINRAPPKTQAALLEAMQERQVTVDGVTRPLTRPFLVVATQNPIEYEGTYPLPEAQLDRFLLRISVGYPDSADENEILTRRLVRRSDELQIPPVVDRETLLGLQAAVEDVHVAPSIVDYITRLVASTRSHPHLQLGASPRGSLALLKASRSHAAISGRDFVTPDDIKTVARPALTHRLLVRPELWVQGITATDVVDDCLASVPTPAVTDTAPAEG